MAEILKIQPPYQKDTNSLNKQLSVHARLVIETTRQHFLGVWIPKKIVGTYVPHTTIEMAEFLTAVAKDADVYRKAIEPLRDHAIIGVEVLRINGLLIEFMSDELRHNTEIIRRAIAQAAGAYCRLPKDIRERPDVIEFHRLLWGNYGLI